MNHLKIGAMAKACNVTPRALRLYQQEGILQPEFVDEESGYRSYSIAQSVKVDMIVQLQNAGFTLKEIADMQSRGSVGYLHDCSARRSDELARQIENLKREKAIADEITLSCVRYERRSLCGNVILERIPERHLLVFDPPTDGDLGKGGDYCEDERWEWYQQYTKRKIIEAGYPLALFRRVGCFVPQEQVSEHMDLLHSRPYVFVDESFDDLYEDAVVLPECVCLTVYYDICHDDNGNDLDEQRLHLLFEKLDEGGYEVDGPFTYENIFRFMRLFNGDAHSFFRYCIPVRCRVEASA